MGQPRHEPEHAPNDSGLRSIRLWVPDLRSEEVADEVRRDVRKLRRHPSDAEGNAFLDAALDEIEGWQP